MLQTTFSLLLLLAPIKDQGAVYVLDTGLTIQDCGTAIAQGVSAVLKTDGQRLEIGNRRYSLACQLEPR
jgi:hypothetical protein